MRCIAIGLCVMAVVASLGDVSAAPTPRLGPADLTGTVIDVNWVAEKKVAGTPGASGTLGRDRVFPAHFTVTLENYDGVSSETAGKLSALVGDRTGRVKGRENVSLILPNKDKDFIKKGMRIRVRQYRISGDEGGTWSTCESIEILSPSPAP